MAPVNRPDYKLNLDGLPQLSMSQTRSATTSQANSPLEAPTGSGMRYPLGSGLGNVTPQSGLGRTGAGSPSKEYGSRIFPKRAREIQQQEGLSPQVWGPPPTGSGHSTPLRETIPESPGSDSFPDFDAGHAQPLTPLGANLTRRTRAGTVPSKFPPYNTSSSSISSLNRSARVTPTSSPFQSSTSLGLSDSAMLGGLPSGKSALLSRIRAGSMPQRNVLPGSSSPFGTSVFASNWMAGRERTGTLHSIRSSDGPSSPRDGPVDNDVRTLDYLGLVDSPQPGAGSMSHSEHGSMMHQQRGATNGGVTIADLASMNAYNNRNTANRFRSFSVNAKDAKERYEAQQAELEEQEEITQYEPQPMYAEQYPQSAAAHAMAIREMVRQHNADVQAFANFASANRPRARTAGVLEAPPSRAMRSYLPGPSRMENSITAADLQDDLSADYDGLTHAVHGMKLNSTGPYEGTPDHANLDTPTRALWLGNIPPSTTVSSLNVLFSQFGTIEFARVLTHKSCGFVNFENVQSAIAARAHFNGKEIFPGAGPVRIGFAKEQSASNTPGANGVYPSPSPDPFTSRTRTDAGGAAASTLAGTFNGAPAAAPIVTPQLADLYDDVLSIVQQFGATPEDQPAIVASLNSAVSFNDYVAEIPPIAESGHTRFHDAPRLREIRKRIDNNSCSALEIEEIAMNMLPEIAELSSDYLGNTVVQKLFEHCSEETKETMLANIAPHLAEIGVHKNGTWAAQKIIDVARTQKQMEMIIEALRPHGVNLFLDQYGNYVMQCCLRFGAPLNGFIFDTMLNRLWDVAQGRFGARAMRACLESHHATLDQKRLMAAAIALHSVQLATNSNGALLLTWFLDTCTFPQRRSVLAPRLIPQLVHLCTHKVAYLTVLKIINQRSEPDARDGILNALFFNEPILAKIVSDQNCGATLIFKVLTTPFLDDALRSECIASVRNTLIRLKVQPTQGYKRLMDEVGLSTRASAAPLGGDDQPGPKMVRANGALPHDAGLPGFSRVQYPGGLPQQATMDPGFGPHLQRTLSMESNGYDPYINGYTHSPSLSNGAIGPINPAQYQQMLQAQNPLPRPNGFYQHQAPGTMPPGLPYASGVPNPQMMDPYRQNLPAQPMMSPPMGMQNNFPQQGGYPPPMMPMNGGMNGYGQYSMPPGYYPQAQMPGPGGHQQRRGRR